METCFFNDDVADGFGECLLECVPANPAFEGGVRFVFAMVPELLITVFGGTQVWGRLEPGSSSVAGGTCSRRELEGRVVPAGRDCVRRLYGPHRGAFLNG